jgi:hypothetical protein
MKKVNKEYCEKDKGDYQNGKINSTAIRVVLFFFLSFDSSFQKNQQWYKKIVKN